MIFLFKNVRKILILLLISIWFYCFKGYHINNNYYKNDHNKVLILQDTKYVNTTSANFLTTIIKDLFNIDIVKIVKFKPGDFSSASLARFSIIIIPSITKRSLYSELSNIDKEGLFYFIFSGGNLIINGASHFNNYDIEILNNLYNINITHNNSKDICSIQSERKILVGELDHNNNNNNSTYDFPRYLQSKQDIYCISSLSNITNNHRSLYHYSTGEWITLFKNESIIYIGYTDWSSLIFSSSEVSNSTSSSTEYDNALKWRKVLKQIFGEMIARQRLMDNTLDNAIKHSTDGSVFALDMRQNTAHHEVLMELSSVSWLQVGDDIDGSTGDQLGYSVALSDRGDIVAIGAPYTDNGNGKVQVFALVNDVWSQLGTDIDGAFFENLGYSVSLDGSGSVLAIGAPYYSADQVQFNIGRVEVYFWDGSSWDFQEVWYGSSNLARLGSSVALSNDGNIVAMGAPDGTSPYVDIYEWDGSIWKQLGSPINGTSSFGYSLSLSSNLTVAVGIPFEDTGATQAGLTTVYHYSNLTNVWLPLGSSILGDTYQGYTGFSVALSYNGSVLAVGSSKVGVGDATEIGRVRIYEWDGSDWLQLGNDLFGRGAGDRFGYTISLNAAGSILAVGSPYADAVVQGNGRVQIFVYNTSSWVQLGEDIEGEASFYYYNSEFSYGESDLSGWSVSVNDEGSMVAIGAIRNQFDNTTDSSGHVRVYTQLTSTPEPSIDPTAEPSVLPTAEPSVPPTAEPTVTPSITPTTSPTAIPSPHPTAVPTTQPTIAPTFFPTAEPSFVPTAEPTAVPTVRPSITPTTPPTRIPSPHPTAVPTTQPTIVPSIVPTVTPSVTPTTSPTAIPSPHPTAVPTIHPSIAPTFFPTAEPSFLPTAEPTAVPTASPTLIPSTVPTIIPTIVPTIRPSIVPTLKPSEPPTVHPTISPSTIPTLSPTAIPSPHPTAIPTIVPTVRPSIIPTARPTEPPNAHPTISPSTIPTLSSTAIPSSHPTVVPSGCPTTVPSVTPTTIRTVGPTTIPSFIPTVEQSIAPTVEPTAEPSLYPTILPSIQPSFQTFTPTFSYVTEVESEISIQSVDIFDWHSLNTTITFTITSETCVVYLYISLNFATSKNSGGLLTIFRNDSTNLGNNIFGLQEISGIDTSDIPVSVHFVDKPGITGNITYSLFGKVIPNNNNNSSSSFIISQNSVRRKMTAIVGCNLIDGLSDSYFATEPITITTQVPRELQLLNYQTLSNNKTILSTMSNMNRIHTTQSSSIWTTIDLLININFNTILKLQLLSETEAILLTANMNMQCLSLSCVTAFTILRNGTSLGDPLSGIVVTGTNKLEGTIPVSITFVDIITIKEHISTLQYEVAVRPIIGNVLISKSEHTRIMSGVVLKGITAIDGALSVTTYSNRIEIGSSEWTPLNMTVMITPNTIGTNTLIGATLSLFSSASNGWGAITIFRNGIVNLGNDNYGLQLLNSTDSLPKTITMTVRDVPQATTVTTYDVYVRHEGQGQFIVSDYKEARQMFSITLLDPIEDDINLGTELPIITDITVIQSDSSYLELKTHFDSSVTVSGSAYCIALVSNDNNNLQSVSQVITDGYESFYEINTNSANITIESLNSLTNYTIYCCVRNDYGMVSSFADTLSTKSFAITECCREIIFTESTSQLSYIFSDPASYDISNTEKYTFTYVLSSQPTEAVTIVHAIEDNSGNIVPSSLISAIPSNQSFKSTDPAAALTGSFIINSTITTITDIIIRLQSYGISGKEYLEITKVITIVPTTDSIPTPSFSSAQFSNSGNSIYLNFSSNTDKAQITDDIWTCDRVFAFTTANLQTCSWISNAVVKVTLQYNNNNNNSQLVEIGTLITLLNNTIKAECIVNNKNCNDNFAEEITRSVQVPEHPVHPNVVVSYPTIIGPCDNITLDFTGTSGYGSRLFRSMIWSVSSIDNSNNNTEAIEELLDSYSNKVLSFISIPSQLLDITTYTIIIKVINIFNKVSSTTMIFTVTTNINQPVVTIEGGKEFSYVASDTITIYASGQFSNCPNSELSNTAVLNYNWQVYLEGVVLDVNTNSNDNRVLLLFPYTLQVNTIYTAILTVTMVDNNNIIITTTSTISIRITSGDVIAFIQSGTQLRVSNINKLVLDASDSFDEDRNNNNNELDFTWSCTVVSYQDYGISCNNVISNKDNSMIIIQPNTLAIDMVYLFTVVVVAEDSRSSSDTIMIIITSTVPIVTIIDTNTIYNSNSNINITGNIISHTSVHCEWTAEISNNNVDFLSLTPATQNFTDIEVNKSMNYPLLITSNNFIGDTIVTFKISCSNSNNNDNKGFSLITVKVNAPPSGGIIEVSPTIGVAYNTLFVYQMLAFTDDASDYPLRYSFTYKLFLFPDAPELPLSTLHQISYGMNSFPAGNAINDNTITIIGKVSDIHNAETMRLTSIIVTDNGNINDNSISNYLDIQLNIALRSRNIDMSFQTISSASIGINKVNCSLTPPDYCRNINRNPCDRIPNTCSNCLSGFIGEIGSSNSICINTTNNNIDIGLQCNNNNDCNFGSCVNNTCDDPIRLCPSISLDTICSGFGDCQYYDIAGNILDYKCRLSEYGCRTQCICYTDSNNYPIATGVACQIIGEDKVRQREKIRKQLCEAITESGSFSTRTSNLLDFITSNLFTAYDPFETVSLDTFVTCRTSLLLLRELLEEDLLLNTIINTRVLLLRIISDFLQSFQLSQNNNNTIINSDTFISSSLTTYGEACINIMVDGQSRLRVISNNVQIDVSRDTAESLKNSTIQTISNNNIMNNTSVSSIEFVGNNVVASCGSGNGYSQFSLYNLDINPLKDDSTVLQSPVFRLVVNYMNTEAAINAATSSDNNNNVQYFLTLAYAIEQNFNLSITKEDVQANPLLFSNVTFPECTYFSNDKYLLCSGCELSSYNNYEATFACFNINLLCNNYISSQDNKYSSVTTSVTQAYNNNDNNSRYLQETDDNPIQGEGSISVIQYGAIFERIAREVALTLSSNPTTDFNPKQAVPVLLLLSLLFVFIVIIWLYLLRLDRIDREFFIYCKENNTIDKAKRYEQLKLRTELGLLPLLGFSRKNNRKQLESLMRNRIIADAELQLSDIYYDNSNKESNSYWFNNNSIFDNAIPQIETDYNSFTNNYDNNYDNNNSIFDNAIPQIETNYNIFTNNYDNYYDNNIEPTESLQRMADIIITSKLIRNNNKYQ